jgi:hypothetical protein
VVCHSDLPANDFTTLFDVLEADPNRYSRGDANVFSCAIGRSFYQRVLPPNHVHLGWSAYSALWLSRIPTLLPGHIWVPSCTGPARDTFDYQAAKDWEAFLSLRAGELRPGGRLVVVLPGAADDGRCGLEDLMDHANTVLGEMVDDRSITTSEHERIVLAAWARPRNHLLAPFAVDGRFQNLVVEHCDNSAVADPAWAIYQHDGNREALVNKHAAFFRATFAPSLASALNHADDSEACRAFSERLEYGLTRRLMNNAAPLNLTVETIVLAKQGAT